MKEHKETRQWVSMTGNELSLVAFSWTCLLQAFPVSPSHLCASLEGGLAPGFVISAVSCILPPFCLSLPDFFKCLWLACSQQREKGISYILPSSETGIYIQLLRLLRFMKVLSSLGRARGQHILHNKQQIPYFRDVMFVFLLFGYWWHFIINCVAVTPRGPCWDHSPFVVGTVQ